MAGRLTKDGLMHFNYSIWSSCRAMWSKQAGNVAGKGHAARQADRGRAQAGPYSIEGGLKPLQFPFAQRSQIKKLKSISPPSVSLAVARCLA